MTHGRGNVVCVVATVGGGQANHYKDAEARPALNFLLEGWRLEVVEVGWSRTVGMTSPIDTPLNGRRNPKLNGWKTTIFGFYV